jgi:predicted transcriptional regulator
VLPCSREIEIGIGHEDTAQKALELMIEHDYSQLPVVDRESKIVEEKGKAYMVTSDSVLRTLNRFDTKTSDLHLRVADAMVTLQSYFLA